MHCRAQGGAVCSDQLVTMSELQCHAAVTSSRGHEARSGAAETSQGQLPPSGRGSKKVAAQDCVQVQYAVCMVSVHHSYTTDLPLPSPATDKAAGVMYGGRGTSSSPPGHSEHRHAHCCRHAAEWQIYCHNNINS